MGDDDGPAEIAAVNIGGKEDGERFGDGWDERGAEDVEEEKNCQRDNESCCDERGL